MKKLLGLLAVTPMALTACGQKDPVVEVIANEIIYLEEDKILIINNVEINGEDDYDAYDKLGNDIKSAWAENDEYGDAVKIKINGSINGEEHLSVDISSVHNDSDTASAFTTFREVLRHYYKQSDNMTSYANFAKHLTDATDPIVPVEHTPETWKGFTDILDTILLGPREGFDYHTIVTADVYSIFDSLENADGWTYGNNRYTSSTNAPVTKLLELSTEDTATFNDAFSSTDYSIGGWKAQTTSTGFSVAAYIYYGKDLTTVSENLYIILKN